MIDTGPAVWNFRLNKRYLEEFPNYTVYTVALPRAVSESVRSLVMWCLRFATSHVKVDMAPISCCSVAVNEDSLNAQRSSRKRAVKMHEIGRVSALRSFEKLLVFARKFRNGADNWNAKTPQK